MKPKQAGNGLYSADAFDDDNVYASDNDYNITECPFIAATFPILLQSQN